VARHPAGPGLTTPVRAAVLARQVAATALPRHSPLRSPLPRRWLLALRDLGGVRGGHPEA